MSSSPERRPRRKRVALISTGGTIEKTYDELEGVMVNDVSNLDIVLAGLETHGVELLRVPLLNKDSRDMDDWDHDQIARTAEVLAMANEGVVIVHGTDRLTKTGERIVALYGDEDPPVPIVLTGAMRPYALRNTDAVQNLTEALLAVQLARPGVYVAMHNRLLRFPGVAKDYRRGTFVRAEELAPPAPLPDPTGSNHRNGAPAPRVAGDQGGSYVDRRRPAAANAVTGSLLPPSGVAPAERGGTETMPSDD
ncbi:MAG: asparaginase domain-containing protein [Myxococcota bacterium]